MINNFYHPRPGGSSHIASSLAKRYLDAGNEVIVITTQYGDSPSFELLNGIPIHRLPSWTLPKSKLSYNFDIAFALKLGNYRRVSKLLEGFSPDVIHQHGQFFDLTWQSGFWARKHNVKSVLTLHTRLVSPVRAISFIFRQLDRFIVNPILGYYKPSRLIAIDNEFISYATDRYSIARKGRLEYISIGVDLEEFEQSITAHDRETSKHKVIASLGHVIPLRDRVALIKAMPQVISKYPDIEVKIIGGIYHDDFLKIAKELNVHENVNCIGAVKKAQVSELLSSADIEIHDLQGFGVGIASLEAMACGVPVIMSVDPSYFPHAPLVDGVNFIQVALDDPDELSMKILQVLGDTELADNLGKNGRDYVYEFFDMRNVAKKYLALFESL